MNASSFGNSDNSRSDLTPQRQEPAGPCVARCKCPDCFIAEEVRSHEFAASLFDGVIALVAGLMASNVLKSMDLVNHGWPSMQDLVTSQAIILGVQLLLCLAVVGAVLALIVAYLRGGNLLWRSLVVAAGILPPLLMQLVLYFQHIGM